MTFRLKTDALAKPITTCSVQPCIWAPPSTWAPPCTWAPTFILAATPVKMQKKRYLYLRTTGWRASSPFTRKRATRICDSKMMCSWFAAQAKKWWPSLRLTYWYPRSRWKKIHPGGHLTSRKIQRKRYSKSMVNATSSCRPMKARSSKQILSRLRSCKNMTTINKQSSAIAFARASNRPQRPIFSRPPYAWHPRERKHWIDRRLSRSQ